MECPRAGYRRECAIPYFIVDRERAVALFERCRDSVVFVGGIEPFSRRFVPMGTGFLALAQTDEFGFQHIVTARHVLDDIAGDTVYVRINKRRGGSEIIPTPKSAWVFDERAKPYLDIAVCPVNIPQDEFEIAHVILDTDVPESGVPLPFGLGDEVFVMGLFTSHHGEAHNIPVMRVGTISAMIDEPILTEYGFMSGYLVEVKSLAGLSGSPVFYRPGRLRTVGSASLVGVMHGHFLIENPEDAISVSGKDKATGQINTGIGLVIPSILVNIIVNDPKLKAERERLSAEAKSKSNVKADSAYGTAFSGHVPPASDANPNHRADFMTLVDAAAQKREQED